MKRSAFTLVELIFVIVIIGVLSAVAVPKFKSLKQNAEVKAVIKTTTDAATSAVSAIVNQNDLEENTSVTLQNIVTLQGKGWSYAADNNGTYDYNTTTGRVATVHLDTVARTVYYGIDCNNFVDTVSQNKCASDLNTTLKTGTEANATLSY